MKASAAAWEFITTMPPWRRMSSASLSSNTRTITGTSFTCRSTFAASAARRIEAMINRARRAPARASEGFLAVRGYRIAPVSVDYADYRYAGPYARHLRAGDAQQAAEYFEIVMQALDAGFTRAEQRSVEVLGYELPQTLLIHCNELNSVTLRTTIQRIRVRGYTFVTLDEAMTDPAYNLPNLRPGELGGGGLFNSLAAARAAAD
jgi:peptidoglycan/xylan/chitin deacetylase (PgdA/CDA1 family)